MLHTAIYIKKVDGNFMLYTGILSDIFRANIFVVTFFIYVILACIDIDGLT